MIQELLLDLVCLSAKSPPIEKLTGEGTSGLSASRPAVPTFPIISLSMSRKGGDLISTKIVVSVDLRSEHTLESCLPRDCAKPHRFDYERQISIRPIH